MPRAASDVSASIIEEPKSKKPKNDYFYETWDKFLVRTPPPESALRAWAVDPERKTSADYLVSRQAKEPKRAKSTSRVARQVEEEKKRVANSPGDGLQSQLNASTSWEQASTECKGKVAAIVEECTRLNRKYRDAVFDVETDFNCLENLSGGVPKVNTATRSLTVFRADCIASHFRTVHS